MKYLILEFDNYTITTTDDHARISAHHNSIYHSPLAFYNAFRQEITDKPTKTVINPDGTVSFFANNVQLLKLRAVQSINQ